MEVVSLADRRGPSASPAAAPQPRSGWPIHELFEYGLLAAALALTVATFARMA